MPLLQLEGNVDRNDRDTIIESQGAEIERLQAELRRTKSELVTVRAQSENAVNAITALRNVLSPVYHALRGIFGEIELVVPDVASEATVSPANPAQSNTKWDFWKKRFGGRVAETIDLLLIQREMNGSQLCSALKCDPRTLSSKIIYPLNKAGLVNKNGGKYSLKEL